MRECRNCRSQLAVFFDHIAGHVYWRCFHCWPSPPRGEDAK